MAWLRALIGVRWLPYAAVAVVAWTASVSGYSYFKGYNSAERKANKRIEAALVKQLSKSQKASRISLKASVRKTQREADAVRRITDIYLPSGAKCDSDEWLHVYNQAIRATPNSTRATGTPAKPERGEF